MVSQLPRMLRRLAVSPWTTTPLQLLVTAATSILCGWAIVVANPTAPKLLTIAIVVAVGGTIVFFATALARARRSLADTNTPIVLAGDRYHSRHAGARYLFYAGLATMPLLSLRVGGVTVSDLLFLGALALALIDVAPDLEYRFPRMPAAFVVGIGIFASGAFVVTVAHSLDPAESVVILLRVLYLLVAWFLLGMLVLRTTRHVRTAIGWWALGVAVCVLYAIAQRVGYAPGVDPTGRVPGLAEHVNDLGSLSAVAVFPALALAYATRQWFWYAGAALAITGVGLSGSLGAAAALLAATLVCAISRPLTKAALVLALIGAGVLFYTATTVGLEGTPLGRYEAVTTGQTSAEGGTLKIRLDTAKVAWEGIKDDPFIGAGLDAESAQVYSFLSGRPHAIHNLFMARWYESGVLGLLGVLVIVWVLLATHWRIVVRSGDKDQVLAIGLLAGSVVFVGLGLTEPLLYKRYALVPAGLGLAMLAISQRGANRVAARPVLPTSRSSGNRFPNDSGAHAEPV